MIHDLFDRLAASLRYHLRHRTAFALIAASGVGSAIVISARPFARADDAPANRVQVDAEPSQPTPLNLTTLYHPDSKTKFLDTPPSDRWMLDAESAQPKLLSGEAIEKNLRTLYRDLASDDQTVRDDDEANDGEADTTAAAKWAKSAMTRLRSLWQPTLFRVRDKIVLLADPAKSFVEIITANGKSWNDPTLSPDGQKLGYTIEGDLYVLHRDRGQTIRLTDDGSETLLDGRLDWTYQEEIFGRGKFKAFWFSPNSSQVAALRIDNSGVPKYSLGDSADDRGLGPVVRYPKAGDPIPHAELRVYDIATGDFTVIDRSTPDLQRIITGVWYSPDGVLYYAISNRVQSWRELRKYVPSMGGDAVTGEASELILREESPAWLKPPVRPIFLSNNRGLLWLTQGGSGRGRVVHITPGGKVVTPISPSEHHVREMVLDQDEQRLILVGDFDDRESLPRGYPAGINQYGYLCELRWSDAGRHPTPRANTPRKLNSRRGWHTFEFAPSDQTAYDPTTVQIDHRIETHETIDAPPRQYRVHPLNGDPELIAETALNFDGELGGTTFSTVATADGIELPVAILGVDVDQGQIGATPRPVVMMIYGGPNNPTVRNRWAGKRRLEQEILARSGIAVVSSDNRSSRVGGSENAFPIYRKMGSIEADDTVAVANWVADQPWSDAERMGLSGWSFGGYLTALTMTRTDRFAAGIAGGMVGRWRDYDAFYTERYMGLPDENADGYDATDVVAAAANLRGRLRIVHGEVDDNVHPTGALSMAAALQKSGKLFDLMIYPGAAHAVRSPAQRYHLKISDAAFWGRHLLNDPDWWRAEKAESSP